MGGRLGDRHRTERSVNPSLRSLTSSRSMALATVHASRVRNCSRTPGGICLIVSSMVTTTDHRCAGPPQGMPCYGYVQGRVCCTVPCPPLMHGAQNDKLSKRTKIQGNGCCRKVLSGLHWRGAPVFWCSDRPSAGGAAAIELPLLHSRPGLVRVVTCHCG